MIGEKVIHSIYGEGTIKEVRDGSKNYQKYTMLFFLTRVVLMVMLKLGNIHLVII